MRKTRYIILLVVTVFATHRICQAQENEWSKNEIALSLGFFSPSQSTLILNHLLADFLFADKDERKIFLTGAIAALYNRSFSQRFSCGFSGSWERLSVKFSNPDDDIKWTVVTILVNGKYYYARKERFRLYSGVAVGAAFHSVKEQDSNTASTGLAYQICGIGIRFGKTIGYFVEGGYGYEGMIKGGLCIRF